MVLHTNIFKLLN